MSPAEAEIKSKVENLFVVPISFLHIAAAYPQPVELSFINQEEASQIAASAPTVPCFETVFGIDGSTDSQRPLRWQWQCWCEYLEN